MSELDDEARIRERAYKLLEEEGRHRGATLNWEEAKEFVSIKGTQTPVAEPHGPPWIAIIGLNTSQSFQVHVVNETEDAKAKYLADTRFSRSTEAIVR